MADYIRATINGVPIADFDHNHQYAALDLFRRNEFEAAPSDNDWGTALLCSASATTISRRLKVLGYDAQYSLELIQRAIIADAAGMDRNPVAQAIYDGRACDAADVARSVSEHLLEMNRAIREGSHAGQGLDSWIHHSIGNDLDRMAARAAYEIGVAPMLAVLLDGVEGKLVLDFTEVFEAELSENELARVFSAEHETYLILTEGSSDRTILSRALVKLYPEVSHLFYFADESIPLPQVGASRITELLKAFVSLKVKNRAIAVFDNDTEGLFEYRRCRDAIQDHDNLQAIILPDLDAFRRVFCEGPDGDHITDINGRAASIEMYLDRSFIPKGVAEVNWSARLKKANEWQGEPAHKERIQRHFHKCFDEPSYDLAGLRSVFEALFAAANLIGRVDAEASLDHINELHEYGET